MLKEAYLLFTRMYIYIDVAGFSPDEEDCSRKAAENSSLITLLEAFLYNST